ncbi:MAG: phosphorylase [Bacteroidetes bacterium]|nr:phosphorylase [Bacteroidota bacterium]
MDEQIPKSELILNSDGSMYHLGILPEELPPILFLVGDPERVPLVSAFFDSISRKNAKREFVSHFGTLRGQSVGVLSTGIGGDNIDIVLNELQVLQSIDLKTRLPYKQKKDIKLIRLGTSGSVNPRIEVDSIVVSESAIGLDGLAWFYGANEKSKAGEFMEQVAWPSLRNTPYHTKAHSLLFEMTKEHFPPVHTLTANGFYRPQGRFLNEEIDPSMHWETLHRAGIDNLEMETAAIYHLANFYQIPALSIHAILANRASGRFSETPEKTVLKMIQAALDLFCIY